MEEQEARQKRPPGKRGSYPPEYKQQILEAFAVWDGGVEEFCREKGVNKITLWKWRNAAKGGKRKPAKKSAKKQSVYTPDQKRQAVEAYTKSGQSLEIFGKLWGLHPGVLARWVRAYRKLGPKALEGRRTGRKPGRKALAPALREGIKEVKAQFPDFGLRKVQGFLARFKGLKVSPPQIRRVVKEESLPQGRSAPPRWKKKPLPRRFERSKPGELWQTDITSFMLPRHSQRVYLVAFMDDYSRYVVSWKLGMKQTAEFVQEALLEGIQRFGKPKELLSDQGRQYHTWRGKSSFHQLLERQGIQHVLSRPKHPQTVGKCERFWKTVGEEFWGRVLPQELHEAQTRLGYYINHYNHFRPHQGLDNSVPADRFFGAENQVRQSLEAAWKENQLAMAVDDPVRQPVFLVGQFGDQALSLHGERGKLVLQTSDGVRQELAAHDLGMSRATPISLEKPHDTGLDDRAGSHEHGTDPDPSAQAPEAGGQAEVGLPDGDTALAGEGHLGAGEPRGEAGGTPEGCADAGTLAGPYDSQGSGNQNESATPEGLADEPAGAERDGGGFDVPAQTAAERDTDGVGEENREGRVEGTSQESGVPGAGQPGDEGATGAVEGYAGADSSDAAGAEGEKNQPQESQSTGPAGSEPGSEFPAEGGVIETELPPLSI
jgi:transposase InsO family protein